MHRLQRLLPVLPVMLLGACASTPANTVASPGPSTDEPAGYCDDLLRAAQILDDGGSEADYNDLLLRLASEGPPDHVETWILMSTLSTEPFSYDNFNPAIDSLDRISDDLDSTCPGLDAMFVDDDGRLRMQRPD